MVRENFHEENPIDLSHEMLTNNVMIGGRSVKVLSQK